MGIAKSLKETKDYRKKSKRSRSFRIPPLTIHRFSHTIRVDYQKQRAVTKPRNQFHDLFHDIRGRNSFHATRFSTSLSPSSASSSSPSSPCPLFPPCSNRTHRRIVRRPERIRVQEIEEQVDQDPRNLVIGTLIPSSFLHRPRRRLAARSLAPAGVESHDEGTRFKGPNVSHRVPPSFASAAVSPPPISTFTRLHTNCTGVYSSFVRLSRCLDRKYRFELSSSFLSFDWKTCLFSDGDAREKTVS